MKPKDLLFLMLFMLFPIGAWAQSDAPQLVVWLKRGDKVYFDLNKLPETTFGNGLLTIKSSTATVDYQLANVLRYKYENVRQTGIENVSTDYAVKISEGGESVTFRNLKPGTIVRLFSYGGMLLEQYTSEGSNPLTITLQNRPSGMYVVKADNETIKVLKP